MHGSYFLRPLNRCTPFSHVHISFFAQSCIKCTYLAQYAQIDCTLNNITYMYIYVRLMNNRLYRVQNPEPVRFLHVQYRVCSVPCTAYFSFFIYQFFDRKIDSALTNPSAPSREPLEKLFFLTMHISHRGHDFPDKKDRELNRVKMKKKTLQEFPNRCFEFVKKFVLFLSTFPRPPFSKGATMSQPPCPRKYIFFVQFCF